MSDNFSFNAPTYFEFNPQNINELDDAVEMYFEIDHEANSIPTCCCDPLSIDVNHECRCSIRSVETTEDKYQYSEVADDPKTQSEFNNPIVSTQISEICSELSEIKLEEHVKLRRSMSTGNLKVLQDLENAGLPAASDRYAFKRGKGSSTERLNQLALPKNIRSNYISTAEQVNMFFHTKRKKPENSPKQLKVLTSTTPYSPALKTKQRQRNNHILSTEEKEQLEIEEYKKIHMKPLPLNPKILQGPMKLLNTYKKPATIIKPFNLTDNRARKSTLPTENLTNAHSKPNSQPAEPFKPTKTQPKPFSFDARDKELARRHQEKIAKSTQAMDNHSNAHSKPNSQPAEPFKPTKTQPMPFSFDARDRESARRHQEKIDQVLQEEKKAREFRANPPPKYTFVRGVKKSSSLNSLRSSRSEDDSKDAPKVFKAKPPVVLYQKPFEPKRAERPLVEVTEFCLNTDRRAKEREEYNKKIQEKLDLLATEKMHREEQQQRQEQEEIAKLRKEIVHPAQPIRHYRETKIERCEKVTIPMSPNLRCANRVNSHNKENSKIY